MTYSNASLSQWIGGRKRHIKWFCSILGVGVLLLQKELSQALPTPAIIWAVALLLVSLAIVLFRTARSSGENPYLIPFSALTLSYAFVYGLGTLNVYYYDTLSWIMPDNPSTSYYVSTFFRAQEAFPEAALLVLLGGLGLIVGTLLSPKPFYRLLPALTADGHEPALRTTLFLLLPLFALSTVLSIQKRAPVLILHIFTLIGDLGFMVLIIAGADIAIKPAQGIHRWWLYILALMTLTFVVGTPTGMRSHTLRPFFLLALGVVIAHRHIPKWMWGALVMLAVFGMPALNYIKASAKLSVELGNLLTSAVDHTQNMEFRERLEDSLQAFGIRVFGLPYHIAMYMQVWPEVYPFEYGKTFLLEASEALPRIIFPWKGEISGTLNWYAVRAGLTPEPDPVTGEWSSATFDGISEYYVNFGPLGVFLLSILNGYYFLVLYDWLVVRSESFFFIALFTYLIWFTWPDNSGFFIRMLSDTRMLAIWLSLFFAITSINRRLLRGQLAG